MPTSKTRSGDAAEEVSLQETIEPAGDGQLKSRQCLRALDRSHQARSERRVLGRLAANAAALLCHAVASIGPTGPAGANAAESLCGS